MTPQLFPPFFSVLLCPLGLCELQACHSLKLSPQLIFCCLFFFPISIPLQDDSGQSWWTWVMSLPLQFASLYDGQVFAWSDCLLDQCVYTCRKSHADIKDPIVHQTSVDYGHTKTPSMHSKSGNATLSQLAFPRDRGRNFPWEKPRWDNTVWKKRFHSKIKYCHLFSAYVTKRMNLLLSTSFTVCTKTTYCPKQGWKNTSF